MSKAFVLLSGGIDSTTCLYHAWNCDDFREVEALSVNYGQRHRKELDYAHRSCEALGIKHSLLDLSSIVPRTMLTDPTAPVPDKSYAEITGVSPTYVPFRNGLMLSAVSSYVAGERDLVEQAAKIPGQLPGSIADEAAQMLRRDLLDGEWVIYFGAHAEDAQGWAYPDCTPEFNGAMANAIYIGSYMKLRLHTPLQWLDKQAIIRYGESLNVPWQNTWSCYRGEELHCGTCPTCRARREGFVRAGVPDPTVYASKEAA